MNRYMQMLQEVLDHEPAGLEDDGTALYCWLREEVQRVVDLANVEPPPDGKEAEELRKGMEHLLKKYIPVPRGGARRPSLVDDPDELSDMMGELQMLLDRTDARDSLSYLERLDAYKPFFQVQVNAQGAVHVTIEGEVVGLLKGLSLNFRHDDLLPTAIARVYSYGKVGIKYVEQLRKIPWMTIERLAEDGSHTGWEGRAHAAVAAGEEVMKIRLIASCNECPCFTDCCAPNCAMNPHLQFPMQMDLNKAVHQDCPLRQEIIALSVGATPPAAEPTASSTGTADPPDQH